ncbi:MAG: hypothetical protein ACFE68_10035 [Candidatus Hodarchaeota archaeon]
MDCSQIYLDDDRKNKGDARGISQNLLDQIGERLLKEEVFEVIVLIKQNIISHKTTDFSTSSKLIKTAKTMSFMFSSFHSKYAEDYKGVFGPLKIKCLLSDDYQKILVYSPEKGTLIISRMNFMEDEEKIVKIIEDQFNTYNPLTMF